MASLRVGAYKYVRPGVENHTVSNKPACFWLLECPDYMLRSEDRVRCLKWVLIMNLLFIRQK